MAKVKSNKKSVARKVPVIATLASKKTQNKAVETPVKKKNSTLLFAIVGLLLAFTIGEILLVTKESTRKQIKPEFVRLWDHHPYTGIWYFNENGDSLFGVDPNRGQVIQFNKESGQMIHVYNVETPINNCIVDLEMNINILDKIGIVHRFNKNLKLKDTITLKSGTTSRWMEVDSKGNIFVVDGKDNSIHKYGPDFKEILSIDAVNKSKYKFVDIDKIYAGPNDDIYCLVGMASGQHGVAIFSNDGLFKKVWPLRNIKKWSNYQTLAITPEGNVYFNVSDENKINVYDNNGKMLSSFDSCKDNSCVITYPCAVIGGMSGNIYILTHHILTLKNILYK
ncbi:MAG: hypothetical protein WCJ94_05930 [bacterium]